ncbi:hypothetical protein ACFQ0Q_35215 [Streptomyces aureus]
MNARHGPSCAAKLRRRGESGQWPKLRIAEEIVACCGLSRLRAHRLAQGWTLVQAVEFFREVCGREDLRCPRIDVDQLRAWETSGRRPVPGTVDLLCRLYRTSPHELGLDVASDHTPEADRPPPDPVGGGGVLEAVRRSVDRTLVAATVSSDQLDLLDERLMSHRRRYVALSPQAMLPDLVADLDEVRALAEQRQPAATQARLSHMTAVLATLIADALMKLGQLRAAAAWYATARTAADDSRDRNVQARVRIQAAILPYYYGPLDAAIRLTQEARLIAPGSETDGTRAFGAVAHARALARRVTPGAPRPPCVLPAISSLNSITRVRRQTPSGSLLVASSSTRAEPSRTSAARLRPALPSRRRSRSTSRTAQASTPRCSTSKRRSASYSTVTSPRPAAWRRTPCWVFRPSSARRSSGLGCGTSWTPSRLACDRPAPSANSARFWPSRGGARDSSPSRRPA